MTLIKFNAGTVVLQGNDIALKLNLSSDKTLVDSSSAPYEYRYVWSPIRMGDSATDYAKFEDGELIASSWIRVPTKPSLDEDTSKGELWVNVPHFAWDVALKYEVRAIDESGLRGEATSTSYFAALYNDFGKITINSVNWHGSQADMMDTLTTTYTIDRLPVMNPIDYDPAVSNVAIASAYKTAVAAALNDPILEVKYWLSSEDGVGTPVSFAPNAATTTIVDWNPSEQITQDFTFVQQISTKRSYFFNLALQMPDPSGDGYVVWEKITWSPYLILKQNNASLKIKKLGITVNMDRDNVIHSGAGVFNKINGIRSAGNKAHSIALYNTESIDGAGIDKPSIGFMDSTHKEIVSIEASVISGKRTTRLLTDEFVLVDREGHEGVFSAKSISLGLHNGKTTYMHIAYADSLDGTDSFSTSDPTGRRYIGTLTNFNSVQSTNPADYTWTLFVGKDGVNGKDGQDGENGLPGTSSTLHVVYGDSINGNGISTNPTGKNYIGLRVVTAGTPVNTQNASLYTWSLIKGLDGANGINGGKGEDGKDAYVHIAYANSGDGLQDFSVSDSTNRIYIGVYTDGTVTDSTDPTKYTWTLAQGRSVVRTETQYKVGDDETAPIYNTDWLTVMPTSWDTSTQAVWTRVVTYYSDSTIEYGDSSKMSELNSIKNDISSLSTGLSAEQTARENIEIGARNLLLDSTNWTSPGVGYPFLPQHYASEDLVVGQLYTATIWGEHYDKSDNAEFWLYMGGGNAVNRLTTLKRGSDGVFRGTFVFEQRTLDQMELTGADPYISVYAGPKDPTTTSALNRVKLEKGNKSTDWSPAPEDLESKIEEFSRWFTLDAGVSTWGQAGSPFKIRIDSDRVSIMMGTEVISYFGQDILDADTLVAKEINLDGWKISTDPSTGFTIS